MNQYSLDILKKLAIVLIFVSAYCGLKPLKITHHAKKEKRITYEKMVRIAVGILSSLMLIFVWMINSYFVIALFSIPGALACLLVVMLAVGTVIKIAFSTDNIHFSSMENNSLVLTGLIFGTVGIPMFTEWGLRDLDKHILGPISDVLECVLLICFYSIYLFLIIALLVHVLKDTLIRIEKKAGKLSDKCRLVLELYKKSTLDIDWKDIFGKREQIWKKLKESSSWRKSIMIMRLSYVFVLDVLGYIIANVAYFFVWFIVVSVWGILFLISNKIRETAKKATNISDYRITTIIFRLSIVASLLIVIILNRMTGILNSEDATAILEYISSVVIMPILFEWIYEIISLSDHINYESVSNRK